MSNCKRCQTSFSPLADNHQYCRDCWANYGKREYQSYLDHATPRITGAGWRLTWVPHYKSAFEIQHAVFTIQCSLSEDQFTFVGSTTCDLLARLKAHFGDLAIDNHRNYAMQRDWNNYGYNRFDWHVLEIPPVNQITACRNYWIEQHNDGCLYNLLAPHLQRYHF